MTFSLKHCSRTIRQSGRAHLRWLLDNDLRWPYSAGSVQTLPDPGLREEGKMSVKEQSALVTALAAVPDPRRQCKNLRHPLVDVLVVGFCGVLCGCEDFVELETFGRKKVDFFRRFLELPEGIPSHDTFRRVFQAVCPQALQGCLIQWLQGLRPRAPAADGAVIAIDGKTLRRTFDRARGLGALHLVSAWATA